MTEKSDLEFWKDTTRKGGLQAYCKVCHKLRENKNKKNPVLEKKWRVELRRRAIVRYGGMCACCGEKTEEFLTIDHVKGGGNLHRKMNKIRAGDKTYRWLEREGWPEGFQVLCYNCNMTIGHYGRCPHEFERQFRSIP